jgi:flagellar hook assembly protein FlgD
VNGGIVFTLPLDSPKIGVWNYSQALESDILAGNIYANVHSSLSPTGEIRSQFESPSPAVGVNVTFPGSNTDLSLFAAPNPLPHDNLALFYRAPEGEMITVEIVDVNGRVVRSLPDVQSSRTGILAWDTLDKNGAKVAGGMYFARLRAGAAETTTRFVVLR